MIKVLHKAFDIIEFLAATPDQPRSLSEIAGQHKIHLATCANILKTMVGRHYVEQIAPKKGYRLGSRLIYLAQQGLSQHRLLNLAKPLVMRLARQTGENVLLVVLQDFRRTILCHASGDQILQLRPDYLLREDVYQMPSGRLLLAYLDEDELAAFIRQYGLPSSAWPEAATLAGLQEQLHQIRRQAQLIHIASGSDTLGIAMPVYAGGLRSQQTPKVVAALGLYLPAFRFKGLHRKKILAAMQASCRQLRQQLSGE